VGSKPVIPSELTLLIGEGSGVKSSDATTDGGTAVVMAGDLGALLPGTIGVDSAVNGVGACSLPSKSITS
jgi:hypothetical protein